MGDTAEVIVPPNEEGTRATVLRWYKAIGDSVSKDEPLVELETDKVTVEIPAPASGTLIEVLKHPNDEVHPDEVIARLSLAAAPSGAKQDAITSAGGACAKAPLDSKSASPTPSDAAKPLSPAVRRLLKEHALAAADINGSGRNGRITAQDVSRHLGNPGVRRVPHSLMRRRIAEHMARSVAIAPHVTTLFEADLTRVLAHREGHAAGFERQGARLTLTAYFIAACVQALRAQPELNSSFEEDALVLHADCNIGVGTALGSGGLIVPVIHRAQGMSLIELARRLGQLVVAARTGKLAPEEVRGGTFTISNHGVGGSLLAAPIVINQPQVAILGIGKVERRVCVLETQGTEAICVRSMCYLTLTIDHRALDAFQANAFLSKIVSTLEQWSED
jgi:2-oxoglutarate dehydrogenase E2 component (dihydrolipoamide succinyltransferase)